jgi:HTH-type transcriptional regulator/antitoxin HigA
MSENLKAARVASPGAVLKDELDARGWTQKELAEIMRRPAQAISEIISGEKRITAETALELSRALGTSAELWLNLESNHQLWKAQRKEHKGKAEAIARKARLYSLAPVSELIKRGWLKKTSSLDALERELCRFLGLQTIDDEPKLAASFRQPTSRSPEMLAQLAWVKRVETVALGRKVRGYSRDRLRKAVPELVRLARAPALAPRALETLVDLGVAVAVVRHLPKSFVDGVAYLRDDGTPVLGLSLRYDRLDSFWFTLMHEVAHLVAGHKAAHLDIFGEPDESRDEREANALARGWLLPPHEFEAFRNSHPHVSQAAILEFSARLGRHPAILVGQLQHEQVVPYTHFRTLLPKVGVHLEGWLSASGH